MFHKRLLATIWILGVLLSLTVLMGPGACPGVPPKIDRIDPGEAEPLTVFTITGTGFAEDAQVRVGERFAPIKEYSATSLEVVLPLMGRGVYPVTVSVADLSSNSLDIEVLDLIVPPRERGEYLGELTVLMEETYRNVLDEEILDPGTTREVQEAIEQFEDFDASSLTGDELDGIEAILYRQNLLEIIQEANSTLSRQAGIISVQSSGNGEADYGIVACLYGKDGFSEYYSDVLKLYPLGVASIVGSIKGFMTALFTPDDLPGNWEDYISPAGSALETVRKSIEQKKAAAHAACDQGNSCYTYECDILASRCKEPVRTDDPNCCHTNKDCGNYDSYDEDSNCLRGLCNMETHRCGEISLEDPGSACMDGDEFGYCSDDGSCLPLDTCSLNLRWKMTGPSCEASGDPEDPNFHFLGFYGFYLEWDTYFPGRGFDVDVDGKPFSGYNGRGATTTRLWSSQAPYDSCSEFIDRMYEDVENHDDLYGKTFLVYHKIAHRKDFEDGSVIYYNNQLCPSEITFAPQRVDF